MHEATCTLLVVQSPVLLAYRTSAAIADPRPVASHRHGRSLPGMA